MICKLLMSAEPQVHFVMLRHCLHVGNKCMCDKNLFVSIRQKKKKKKHGCYIIQTIYYMQNDRTWTSIYYNKIMILLSVSML